MAATITVSYSELDTFRQCPLKHALAYKQRWRKDQEEGSALSRGTLWHNVMEQHYLGIQEQALRDTKSTEAVLLAHARTRVLPWLHTQGQQTEQQILVEWMYEGYVEQYGSDPQWEILATELPVETWLLNERGNRTRFRLKAKIDLIVRDRTFGGVWAVDHKSAKDLDRQKSVDLDDQFGLYSWLLRQIGKPVRGSTYSGARTQRNKGPMTLESRFSRIRMARTDIELNNLALDAYRAARMAYSPMNDQPYSSPNPQTCGWKCDFEQVHLAARKGVPITPLLKDFGFSQDFRRH